VAELPTGTVTFLFTDVEGSTRLLNELGDAYAGVLADHRRALRECFDRHGGVEVDTQGDAFFVAFARASDALAAAAEGRDALTVGPIRVRMGVHTGEPVVTDEGYVGVDVHRAARIAAAGHGGQILISQATRDLVGNGDLRDLGEHRLKDLTAAERLYQLGAAEFPSLKSLNQSNLPIQPTELVGRRRELQEIRELQRTSRMLTLTGAGGSGKTRLALQAAAEVVDEFPDGVWFVSLAALTDYRLVHSTIGQVVGARDDLGQFLQGKNLLLLLDNLEHLLPDVAPQIAELDTTILATSRERINIASEQEYPVPTLPIPDAVSLFVQRARQLKPRFEADEHVAEIVRRLDGLPLAVELAAARVKVLTTEQIRDRLGHSLGLLISGRRDAPERHQALRATIEWSYQLLGQEEQLIFTRFAVFGGSFDLEAAEVVCGSDIDVLQSLVDKSLLRQTKEGRFFMLETIREYAVEELERRADISELSRRHAEHYSAVAKILRPRKSESQEAITKRLRFEVEQPNLRAALEHFLTAGVGEAALEMVEDLWFYWMQAGQLAEGELWTERALATAEATPSRLLGSVLSLHGEFLRFRGAVERAIPIKERATEIARSLGDHREVASNLHDIADSWAHVGDYERARAAASEALGIRRALGDPGGIAHALSSLGDIALFEGEFAEARRIYEEVLALILADSPGSTDHAVFLFSLAECRRRQGDYEGAAATLFDAIEMAAGLSLVFCAPDMLDTAAGLTGQSDARRGALLVGAAEALRTASGFDYFDRAEAERIAASLRDSLGESRFKRAVDEGRQLTLDEAMQTALESLD